MTAPYAELFAVGCARQHDGRRCGRTPSYALRSGRCCSSHTPAALAGVPEPTPLHVPPAPAPAREQVDGPTARKILRALRRYLAMRNGVAVDQAPAVAVVVPPAQRQQLPTDLCGCPTSPARTVVDELAHTRWHRLVVEQGGPAGAVDAHSLREVRGGDARRLRSAS